MEEIGKRKSKILKAIVEEYIDTAEPVSSGEILKKYDMDISSATIRNEMVELEKLGLIAKPYSSAGRVPSEQGYRYYVDKLIGEEKLSLNEFLGGLYIPSLELKTPIYYGTAPQAIENGVGLMETTDRLGQGKGHHSGLTSHSGLSISRLFTDLPKIKKGDQFYIKTVEGEILAYEVKELETVLPTKLDVMIPEKDKDLVTLVTCVPLFINTHRLLVKGERIEYKGEQLKTATPFLLQHKTYIIVVVCSILFIVIFVRIIESLLKKKAKQKEESKMNFME